MSDEITLTVATCTLNAAAKLGDETFTKSNIRKISGWINLRATRGIERCPSDFEVSYTEPYPAVADVQVQEGDWVQVQLGNDLILTGFVDRCQTSITSASHSLRITGRSKCQDLVDCGTSGQVLNMPVDKIAEVLCNPFGIKVNVATGTNIGGPINQFLVVAGETPYAALELVCRYRALLLYDQPDGSLMIAAGGSANTTGPLAIGTRVAASGFTEGINVQEMSLTRAMDGRYSRYDAVYQGLDTFQDTGDGGNLVATVTDPTVPRYRYRVIISEQVTGGAVVAEQRANWEMAYRMGRSYQVRLTTDSWRDSAGVLYEPNTLVDIDLPGLKLEKKRWLIAEVTYLRSARGTFAQLVIVPPQAFYQEPIVLNPVSPDVSQVSQ
ncbi:phage baseplate assembly protein [Robbsia andropogonis]|uniref:phage baseplate assembly protein n=1 Tax=Robbsia andropogonis TaxID=28092 RepID=UPI003D259BD7